MKIIVAFLFLLAAGVSHAQVKFDANFESGNLKSVTTADSANYFVTSRSDIGGRWFYFRMANVKNRMVSVTIVNSDVNRPLYSYDNKEFYRFLYTDSPKTNYFHKVFEQDTVYVAYYIPYNYGHLQERIKQWTKHRDVSLDTLGVTIRNMPIQMLTITDKSADNKNKKKIWIHARTHPSETPSSWHLDGIISKLLADDKIMDYYRKNMIFYIVPFTNPDGVFYGKSRTNYDNVDVESCWDLSDDQTCREVFILRNKMKQICDSGKLSVFLNMHSQASKSCTFWIHTVPSINAGYYSREYFFSNLNASNNPYFLKADYSESSLQAVFPEGWLYANYGPDVLALTYETPYDQYSTGIWVTNENLSELGARTVYALAEFLNISHPEHLVLDNREAFVNCQSRKDSSGVEFFGNDYLILNSWTNKGSVEYTTGQLKAGKYSIDGWWPSAAGLAADAKYIIEGGGRSVTVEKNQQKNGGQWNPLSDFELSASGMISIKVENNALMPVAADAFRVIYKGVPSSADEICIPGDFVLSQNYPNPFNPETTICYKTNKAGHVKLIVYDILGNEVKTLVDDFRPAGSHTVRFNAAGLSSGVYIYRLIANRQSAVKKMILIK